MQARCEIPKFLRLAVMLALAAAPGLSQQEVVTQYDAFGGYGFVNRGNIKLFENGFAAQVHIRPRPWYALGLTYTNSAGDWPFTPDLLPAALQQQLDGMLGLLKSMGLIPAGYALSVPVHSATQTFSVGPELAYRHFSKMTLFLRPVLAGAIRETATAKPGDAIAQMAVAALSPSGQATEWAGFVGFGGGFDIPVTHRFALRTQADLTYDRLFNDVLKNDHYAVRFSIGPVFHFGRNIRQ